MKLGPSENPDSFDVTFERKDDVVVFVNAMNEVWWAGGVAGIRRANLMGA